MDDNDLQNNSNQTGDNSEDNSSDSDLILDSNTGNNDFDSRVDEEDLSNQIFGGAQIGTGILGANNEGFIDDIGAELTDSEDNDDVVRGKRVI